MHIINILPFDVALSLHHWLSGGCQETVSQFPAGLHLDINVSYVRNPKCAEHLSRMNVLKKIVKQLVGKKGCIHTVTCISRALFTAYFFEHSDTHACINKHPFSGFARWAVMHGSMSHPARCVTRTQLSSVFSPASLRLTSLTGN